jgi:hypothetical protein
MTSNRSAGLALFVVSMVVACGGSTASNPSDAGGHDAQVEDAQPAVDAGPGTDAVVADAPAEAGYLACLNAAGQLDDSLKTCQSDGDCVIEQEQTDCCGTILFVGVNSASASEFDACEAAWVSHFPGCGCASGKTSTEDGKTTQPGVDGGSPQVHCTDFTMSGGICLTYTP